MITIEKKLDVFTKMVLEKAQGEYEEKLKELAGENNRRMEEYKEELDKRCCKIIDDLTAKGEAEKNRIISKAKVHKKKKVLSKKEELVERTTVNILKMAEQYTFKDEYNQYMKEAISQIFTDFESVESITIYILDRDKERYWQDLKAEMTKYLFNEAQIRFIKPKEQIIGGLIAVDDKETKRMDYSLKTIIDEKKILIGQMLYEALKR